MASMTETGYLRAAIIANGGTCDDLPDNLESTLYKRLIEVCANGGGGSSEPVENTPSVVYISVDAFDESEGVMLSTAYLDSELSTPMDFEYFTNMAAKGPITIWSDAFGQYILLLTVRLVPDDKTAGAMIFDGATQMIVQLSFSDTIQ